MLAALPQLFTDKVTVDCARTGKCHFQILPTPDTRVQQRDTSLSSIELKVISGFGIICRVPPRLRRCRRSRMKTVPSAIASGLSFNGQLNAGALLAGIAADAVTDGLFAELVPLIRAGH